MPPAGYPAFLQYLQSGRVSEFECKEMAPCCFHHQGSDAILPMGSDSKPPAALPTLSRSAFSSAQRVAPGRDSAAGRDARRISMCRCHGGDEKGHPRFPCSNTWVTYPLVIRSTWVLYEEEEEEVGGGTDRDQDQDQDQDKELKAARRIESWSDSYSEPWSFS